MKRFLLFLILIPALIGAAVAILGGCERPSGKSEPAPEQELLMIGDVPFLIDKPTTQPTSKPKEKE